MTSRSWVASFTCMLQIFTIWKTYYQQTKQHVHIISRIISSRLLSVRRVLQKHKAGTQRRHEMLEFPVFAVLHLWCTHLINYFLDLACFMPRRRLSCWDYCVTVSFFFSVYHYERTLLGQSEALDAQEAGCCLLRASCDRHLSWTNRPSPNNVAAVSVRRLAGYHRVSYWQFKFLN